MKIAVIGAGIIGLSSAVAVAEKYRDDFSAVDVTLFAETVSPNTTGDGSAGFICPYLLGNTPQPLVL